MIKVKLGEMEYDVPKMNIGQVEDIASLDVPAAKWSFAALKILMTRAKPEIKDVRAIEAEPGQVREAIEAIMRASGYVMPESKNPEAPEANPGQAQA